MTTGDRIRIARERRGWSKAELARQVGVCPASITNWEQGITAPHIDKICDVAQALHTTVEALCGRTEYCRGSEILELKKENLRLRNALIRIRKASQKMSGDILETLFPDALMEGDDE